MDSISVCLRLVRDLNGKMLEFDFRNGPLRRKYDGLKYAVKAIEDIYFELSLQDAFRKEEDGSEPDLKRPRGIDGALGEGDTSPSLLNAADFDAIRGKMEAFDKCREVSGFVISKSCMYVCTVCVMVADLFVSSREIIAMHICILNNAYIYTHTYIHTYLHKKKSQKYLCT